MIKKKTILKYAFDLKKKTISNNFVKQWPSATAIYISIVVWNHYCPNDYFRYNDLIKLNTVLTHNIWILPSNKNTLQLVVSGCENCDQFAFTIHSRFFINTTKKCTPTMYPEACLSVLINMFELRILQVKRNDNLFILTSDHPSCTSPHPHPTPTPHRKAVWPIVIFRLLQKCSRSRLFENEFLAFHSHN